MRVYSGNGTFTIDTNKVIGNGGEANVYAVKGKPNSVAKIYNHPTLERAAKLNTMVPKPPVDPGHAQGHVSIAWPEDILSDKAGNMLGYLMPKIKNSFPFHDVYNTKARRQLLPAGFGYQYLLRTAHNLCTAVAAVHDMGYVIGDLNDCNIFVQPDARVTLIDCDSFQVGSHRCPVGVPMYIAPEIQGITLSSIDREVEQDNFALAILVHQLLMSGVHPYAGVGEPGELGERIKKALTPYSQGGPNPPPRAPHLEWLPAALQQMFRAAFADGHNRPEVRPEARVWADQLLQAENDLVTCKQDINHPYFNHLSECPDCQAKAARAQQARKGQATQGPANFGQQPLPGLRTNGNSSKRSKFALFATLFVCFLLAYQWSAMKETNSRFTATSGFGERQTVGKSASSDWLAVSPARRSNDTKTASDIYFEFIGESPYQPQTISAPISKDPADRVKRNRGSYSFLDENEAHDNETGSEIYERYIGESPY